MIISTIQALKESICLKPKLSQSFFVDRIQSEVNFLKKKNFFRNRGRRGLSKKKKKVGGGNCAH